MEKVSSNYILLSRFFPKKARLFMAQGTGSRGHGGRVNGVYRERLRFCWFHTSCQIVYQEN